MLDISLVRTWTKSRFVMDSGFYAGRGPTPSDLNFAILEMFYEGIKKDVGAEAAKNFVRFVNKLTDLSASAFIVAFERFADSDCKVVDIAQSRGDGNRLTGYGDALHAQAFALIATALTSRPRSATENRWANDAIKAEFIAKHIRDIPKKERCAA